MGAVSTEPPRPIVAAGVGTAPPSPAGPISEAELAELPRPPEVPLPRSRQVLAFSAREIEFVFRWRRRLGEVFHWQGIIPGGPTITSHPEHARSLFTADPALVPSLTAESPLVPIVGPRSVLTANGARHLRQRRLLLPPFHGEAIERYTRSITDIAEREIDTWPLGEAFSLAPRMQAITLDVITSGILGIDGRPERGTPAHGLAVTIKRLTALSTTPLAKLAELMNLGRREPVGLQKRGIDLIDRYTYALIAERRAAGDLEERTDILSLIMRARTESEDGEGEGEPLTDRELRDELLTLVFAGFETTANSLAWAWERLVRHPDAYEALREAVRHGSQPKADAAVERVILETMRSRPVIPAVGRRVQVPWRLGEYGVAAGSAVTTSILLIHHREDLYPDPFAFRPERWIEPPAEGSGEPPRTRKAGTYEWIPFGGGTRRCLGAALAMAEQRVVLAAMAQRLDLVAEEAAPEHAQHRNVTMIPGRGGRVVVRSRA